MSEVGLTTSLLQQSVPTKPGLPSSSMDLPSAEQSARSSDIHAFENALHYDPQANQIMGQVDHISNALAEKKVAYEKALKKATETQNPADMIDTARAISEYSLHTAIVTKAASKSSQAIQKLTSPQ